MKAVHWGVVDMLLVLHPHPPLLQQVEWTNSRPVVYTNVSVYRPSPWHFLLATFPSKEGKAINISLGFKTLPLCIRYHKSCPRT